MTTRTRHTIGVLFAWFVASQIVIGFWVGTVAAWRTPAGVAAFAIMRGWVGL